MLKDDEGEVRGGPADGLEGEEADEGGEGRVVDTPAGEEAGGEGEALVAGEDGLHKPSVNVAKGKRAHAPIRPIRSNPRAAALQDVKVDKAYDKYCKAGR